jgi:hypothetical protein
MTRQKSAVDTHSSAPVGVTSERSVSSPTVLPLHSSSPVLFSPFLSCVLSLVSSCWGVLGGICAKLGLNDEWTQSIVDIIQTGAGWKQEQTQKGEGMMQTEQEQQGHEETEHKVRKTNEDARDRGENISWMEV